MTFDELVTKCAADNGVSKEKTRAIIQQALKTAKDEALQGRTAPLFFGIGRFVSKPVRSHGRKADGTKWERPPRIKLGLATDLVHEITPPASEAAA